METTGDVYDPNYYMIDNDSGVVYRREQFLGQNTFPEEFIVRDRRFSKYEIVKMCEDLGLKVTWAKYVAAGKWEESLSAHDDKAKEILLLCEKPNVSDYS